jgi:predicted dithiol-disulfide oxidoreductase (DUF899 family)
MTKHDSKLTAMARVNGEVHQTESKDAWLTARKALLAKEKALTHLHDVIAAERQSLPWKRVEKAYLFETPSGRRSLADLFDGRRQLLVQHFMFAPGWKEGCRGCSFMADHVDPMLIHLAQRDVTFVAVSRATLGEIELFRDRMGWKFPWVSAVGSEFNIDYRVTFTPEEVAQGTLDYNYGGWPMANEEWPGISTFIKDDAGEVFHTYSTFGRGVEVMMGTYQLLDLMPKGRDEAGLGHKMEWIRHHDRYQPASPADAAGCPACASEAGRQTEV